MYGLMRKELTMKYVSGAGKGWFLVIYGAAPAARACAPLPLEPPATDTDFSVSLNYFLIYGRVRVASNAPHIIYIFSYYF